MTFTALAMIALLAGPAPMPEASALRCPHTDGLIDGPFASTPATATAIYRAIRPGVGNGPNPEFPEIEVSDEGDHWEVMENRKRVAPSDPMVSIRGGGQLYLRIDKCTGAISGAAYNR